MSVVLERGGLISDDRRYWELSVTTVRMGWRGNELGGVRRG